MILIFAHECSIFLEIEINLCDILIRLSGFHQYLLKVVLFTKKLLLILIQNKLLVYIDVYTWILFHFSHI